METTAGSLLPLLDIPRRRVNKLRMPDCNGIFSIVSRKDLDKIDPASIRHRVRISLFLNTEALPLSPTQEEYLNNHLEFSILWPKIERCHYKVNEEDN